MSGGKLFKEWQVTDKIVEWIILQFIFNILQITQTQKIITCRILKIYKWIWGDVYQWGKVSKPWQVTDKIIEWFSYNSYFTFYEWLKLKKK